MKETTISAFMSGTQPTKSQQSNEKPPAKNKSTLNKMGHFLNGIISNTVMIGCIQPLYTWKTHRMNGMPLPRSISKLYNGTLVNVISGGPPEGMVFLAQETFSNKNRSPLHELGISSLAGCVGAPMIAALERITILQQLYGGSAKSHVNKIIAKERIIGIFKALVPTMGREALFNIGVFALHDIVHDNLFKNETNRYSHLFSSIFSGAIAGSLSTPFDLIKTRMQADVEGKFTGLLQTAKWMVKTHGKSSLLRGMGARSATIALSTGLIYQSKEMMPPILPNCFHNHI